MEKVTSNLLSNAIKFTPEGGRVELSVGAAADGAVEMRVTDTGPGIPADAIERIFDRFYQVDGTSTRHHEGTGIGLALARELILLHGGTIHSESEPGGGALFIVTLPHAEVSKIYAADSESEIVTVPDDRQTAADLEDDAADGSGDDTDETVILVVEDNTDMRTYLAAGLESIGRVVLAENGEDGMDRAFDEVPDLIVSDVMMPGVDGLELCSALKEDRRTSHIPILLLTARADHDSRVEGYDRGADAYLAKPFSKPELLARTRGLLANRQRLHAHFKRTSVLTLPDVDVSSRDATFLEDVTTVLEENLADPNFGVDRLADAAALSKRQLLRKLNALTGQPPSEMLRRLRMERAGALLSQDAGTVKETAHAVGYRSASSFRKAFNDHYGTSPSKFTGR
ncbi:MAG: ATP-binding protein, partial [Rhodothermales bacterium]